MKSELLQEGRLHQVDHAAIARVELADERAEGTHVVAEETVRLRGVGNVAVAAAGNRAERVDRLLEIFGSDLPVLRLVAEIGNEENGNVGGNVHDVLFEVLDGFQLTRRRNQQNHFARIHDENARVTPLVNVDAARPRVISHHIDSPRLPNT